MLVSSVPLSLTHHGWLGQALENGEIELEGDAYPRDRGVGDERQAISTVVIDQGEDPEPTSADQRVRHEVEAPALVRPLRDRHGRPRAQCPLAATAPAHLQTLLAIQPPEFLVVYRPSVPAQQPLQSAIIEPAALPRQVADAGPCLGIVRPTADIAHRRSILAQRLARRRSLIPRLGDALAKDSQLADSKRWQGS